MNEKKIYLSRGLIQKKFPTDDATSDGYVFREKIYKKVRK
jgi:hypothetical protein